MEQVAGYPCFGLAKENTMVKVEAWLGDITTKDEFQEVWLKLRKLNPKWCEWTVLD